VLSVAHTNNISSKALTLMSTLLKQGPTGTPVASKVIIVTPTSLIGVRISYLSYWSTRLRTKELGKGDSKVARVDESTSNSYKRYRYHEGASSKGNQYIRNQS